MFSFPKLTFPHQGAPERRQCQATRLGPRVERLKQGYQLFLWSILVGEPSPTKRVTRHLPGTQKEKHLAGTLLLFCCGLFLGAELPALIQNSYLGDLRVIDKERAPVFAAGMPCRCPSWKKRKANLLSFWLVEFKGEPFLQKREKGHHWATGAGSDFVEVHRKMIWRVRDT